MSDEVFRQGERLTAAKLNRILAALGVSTSDFIDLEERVTEIENFIADLVIQEPPDGLTEGDVNTLIATAIANIQFPGTPTGTVIDVDVTSGNATVSSNDFSTADTLQVIGATTQGRTVTMPSVAGTVAIVSARTNTRVVTLVKGTTTYRLGVGGFAIVYLDGSANYMRILAASATVTDPLVNDLLNEVRQFTVSFAGDNAETIPVPLAFSIVIPAGTYSEAIRGTANATGSAAYTVQKNGSTIGTATVGAGALRGNLVVGSAVTISGAGVDDLDVAGPATADATLVDVSLSVPYRRVR